MKLMFVWAMDLLSNFRTHIALFSIAGGMIATIFFHSLSIAMVFLVLLLCVLLPLSSWGNVKTQSLSANSHAYGICSFNIEWNAAEHHNTLEYIKHCSTDILVLQEVTAPLKEIISQYKDRFPFQHGEGHSHVMVLSKHKLTFVKYLPWPGKFQQRAMHVICELEGRALHIIAIHLQVTRRWNELARRDQQIDTLNEYLKSIDGPIMLVGDFNAGTASRVLREIKRRTGFFDRESLLTYQATWPSRLGCLGIQLDHIFFNNEIVLAKSKLGPVLDSDHRPIYTRFKFL